MKKNLLFIMTDLKIGGGQKSLISLLENIDYDKYNVDLLLINNEGIFKEYVPKQVNILENMTNLETFKLPICQSIMKFLNEKKLGLIQSRILFFVKNRTIKNKAIIEQYSWKYFSKAFDNIKTEYDIAISYLEKTPNYLCVDCIKANKKIGWIHTDYSKLKVDKNFDLNYFNKLDNIITISTECREKLVCEFPKIKNKFKVINNIVSPKIIKKMAKESIDIEVDKLDKLIVSIGRINYEKGFDMAVKACKELINDGYRVKWYLIGEGSERKNLEQLIKKYSLHDKFILLGENGNPYKYLSRADIYVQPSRFEGKSIAIDEAKILNKPIVATNFNTVKSQISHNIDGLIVEMNEFALANGIKELIKNDNLFLNIKSNLYKQNLNTEKEIYKFYDLLK